MGKGCGRNANNLEILTTGEGVAKINIVSSDDSIEIADSLTDGIKEFDLTIGDSVDLSGIIVASPSGIQLTGDEIDVDLTWQWYHGNALAAVTVQEYDNQSKVNYDAGVDPVYSELASDDTRALTEDDVTTSRVFLIKGNDGLGNGDNSEAVLTKILLFGNYVYSGELAQDVDTDYDRGDISAASVVAIIQGLSKTKKTSRTGTFTGTGVSGATKYRYYAFPSSYDPNDYFEDVTKTAQYGFFQEGDTLRSGFFLVGRFNVPNDAETPFTEEYKLYQSASDMLNGIKHTVR